MTGFAYKSLKSVVQTIILVQNANPAQAHPLKWNVTQMENARFELTNILLVVSLH